MKPIYTVNAGEYLVGSFIEENFKNLNIWIPSKDTGIDILLTNSGNNKSISLQVKFSKDFLPTSFDDIFQRGLKACGWWSLNLGKIEKSEADFWIFVLHSFKHKENQFIIIKPSELIQKYKSFNKITKSIQSYFWVTEKNRCWETRGLKKQDHILIANDHYKNEFRNFSKYLNDWKIITKLLK